MLATVLVLLLVTAGIGIWTVQRSFPTTTGRIDVPGLSKPVTVSRDAAGIPQITADTAHDLFYAQGFVHSQDRFWEMDFRRHVTSGRLAEMFGESQVGTDSFIRTLGWRATAEAEVAMLDTETLGYYEAYAEGVNAYLGSRSGADLSLEYAVLGLQNGQYQPERWTPADSVAWLKAMAWDLRSNLEDEIDRALLATALPAADVALLHPAYPYGTHPTIIAGSGAPAAPAAPADEPDSEADASADAADAATAALAEPAALDALDALQASLAALPELIGPAGNEIGSNSWVVAGALTESGSPLLANDPHLGAAMPSVWYQMGLRCSTVSAECPFDVAGYSFSGLPGIIIGHNASIAWGLTNLGPDVADLYLEKVTPDGYELDGAVHPFTVRTETITVAGGEPVELEIRSTARGPVVSGITDQFGSIAADYPAASGLPAGDYALSLQWTALTPGHTPSAVFAIDKAQNWDEFRAGARLFEVPSQNLIYADTSGNIGYQAPGRIPIRSAGDGTLPLPGWTSENGWVGEIPFEELPSVLNPESGMIVTANNSAVGEGFPRMLTQDWDLGYRAQQINDRLTTAITAGEKLTVKGMASIQADNFNANAAALAPVLAELPLKPEAAEAQRLLANWDYSDDADSAASAYFNMTWRQLLAAMFHDKLPESTWPAGGDRWFGVVGALLEQPDSPWWTNERLGISGRDAMLSYAAEQAWQEGVDTFGADPRRWQWGKLHTLTLTNASFGESGIAPIEWLFNRGPIPVAGGSSVVNAVGWDASTGYTVDWVPSMRMVVDLADLDDSTWVNLTGASGHAFHPHYDDQTPLWQEHKTRTWAFTPDTVREAARDVLQLHPKP
ncbi:penicillin acylase family protein [Microterricola viridarii]|uniref:penicillin acylase family protein n=1 Tax=Microterricola viridarii TaxID=412690 RepID=UPI000A502F4F|nr:penicillin acylase family protein [Microterricola viridarii]